MKLKYESWLFFVVRKILVVAVFVLLLMMTLSFVDWMKPYEKDGKVKMEDLSFLDESANINDVLEKELKMKVSFPKKVKEYLINEENEKLLKNWVTTFSDKEDEQEEYLENLAILIKEAEVKKKDVTNVINQYRMQKQKKWQQAQIEKESRKTDDRITLAKIFALSFLLILLTLALLLFRIEKNTRKEEHNQLG